MVLHNASPTSGAGLTCERRRSEHPAQPGPAVPLTDAAMCEGDVDLGRWLTYMGARVLAEDGIPGLVALSAPWERTPF